MVVVVVVAVAVAVVVMMSDDRFIVLDLDYFMKQQVSSSEDRTNERRTHTHHPSPHEERT